MEKVQNFALLPAALNRTVRSTGELTAGPERADKERREIRIFGYFSFFMYARIISERDFQTIHLKIILGVMI